VQTLHVVEDVAYLVWHARCEAVDIVFASDTFLIRDGKISVQTYSPKIEPR